MKPWKFIILSVIVTIVLSSCGGEDKVYKLEHFATGFRMGHKIRVFTYNKETPYLICLQREPSRETPDIYYDSNKKSERTQCSKIARNLGDTCHRETVIEPAGSKGHGVYRVFSGSLFQSISITSNIDWGSTLPAGSDISAEFILAMVTFDHYIQTCQKPQMPRPIPEDVKPTSPWMQNYIKSIYAEKDTYGEPLVGHLQSIDFSQIKYWSVSNYSDANGKYDNMDIWPGMYLTSNHSSLSKPQTLTFKVTYQDGMSASTSLEIK